MMNRQVTAESHRIVRMLATVVVIVPFVTAVIRAIRNDWFPIGDNALLFIRTRDVLTGDHPYLGSWTSASLSVGENMNNPGAMYDWLVAPFAHVLPPGPAAAIGVGVVNVAMVCVISASAHRIGGWAFQRWALLFSALLAWSMGSEMLFDIWQANALIFPFFALLILSIGIAVGDDQLLIPAAVISSLLLQTHISYAYVFVFVLLGVGSYRIWQRRHIDSTRWRRPVVISVGVLAVLWSLSIWEQFFGPGKGNVSRLLSNASGGDLSLGVATAAKIVAQLGLVPPFWGRSGYSEVVTVTRVANGPDGPRLDLTGLMATGTALLIVSMLALALVALTWRAHRSEQRLETAAGVLASVLLISSVLALSRLTIGEVGFSPHHVRWMWPMMAFIHFTLALLTVSAWRRSRSADQVLTLPIAFVVVIASVWNVQYLAHPSGPTAEVATMATMRRIEPQLDLLAEYQPILFDVATVRIFEPYSSTMMMWLQERDIEFRVDDEIMIRQLGEARRSNGDEPTTIFQLQGIEALTYEGSACLVAQASLLDNDEADAARALVEAEAESLAATEGISTSEAYDALIRREVEVTDPDQQLRVGIWIDSTYALFGEGTVCADPELPA